MRHVAQPKGSRLCGHACLAMVLKSWGMARRFHKWTSMGVVREFTDRVLGIVQLHGWRCKQCKVEVATQAMCHPRRDDLDNMGVGVDCPRTRWERLREEKGL